MAAVTLQLGRASLGDPISGVVALIAAVLLIRFNVNATWLVVIGGIVGVLKMAVQ